MFWKCGCAHAEYVFKVDDDFSNFIQMFTVAVEIAKNFTIKYGRCALLYPFLLTLSCSIWAHPCPVCSASSCLYCTSPSIPLSRFNPSVRASWLSAQQPAEHSAGVALHRGVQCDAGGQPGGLG